MQSAARSSSAPSSGLSRSKSVVRHLDAQFKGAVLFQRGPVSDGHDWSTDDVLLKLAAGKLRPGRAGMLRLWVRALAKDPRIHAIALSAGSGAVVLGTCGASCGLVLGAIAGGFAGAVPAPLTLGLSIPLGAAGGSALGTCVGVVACSGIGLVGAGVAGGVAYEYRVELLKGITRVKARVASGWACADGWVLEAAHSGKARAGDVLAAAAEVLSVALSRALQTSRWAVLNAQQSAVGVASKAAGLRADLRDAVSDRQLQVAKAATGGAVVLGAGGGAVGLFTGSALGAVWGIIPALLTFGLSIPLCATVCGGAGLCAGAALGGVTGLVGGAAAGYAMTEESFLAKTTRSGSKVGGRKSAVACVGGTGGTA